MKRLLSLTWTLPRAARDLMQANHEGARVDVRFVEWAGHGRVTSDVEATSVLAFLNEVFDENLIATGSHKALHTHKPK